MSHDHTDFTRPSSSLPVTSITPLVRQMDHVMPKKRLSVPALPATAAAVDDDHEDEDSDATFPSFLVSRIN